MLSRIEVFARRLRRNLSRSVWLARLLRLPVSRGSPTRPGLIMIQIDGLSQPQLERAVDRGELPFLKRLLRREHYRLHAHYSGLPSTTSAVQAELFYGTKCAVPAFSFRDHESRLIVRMLEPHTAAHIEALQAGTGNKALLEGGSAYADCYTGGAAESHFCPSSIGWGSTLRAANPLALLAFLIGNFYSLLRVAGLLPVELALALFDFARGLVAGQDFVRELKFIPTRVAIVILLRELCVIGAKIDISRGLPIIHINFLGYDEQSHRRGPHSLFAHWTLRGIDDAVARLWRASNQCAWRHYEVWIYSDHGQAAVRPYQQVQGYTLEEAVTAACEGLGMARKVNPRGPASIQTQRVRVLGGQKVQRLFSVLGLDTDEVDEQSPRVAALGPLGHVYLPPSLREELRDSIARELARTHKVALVLSVMAPGMLCARTDTGDFRLPRDRALLFGSQHPFLDSIGEDLVRLCEHPDAGDLVLLGWRDGVTATSFAAENGAHGGVSPEETHGFALLPEDTPITARDHDYLRPIDLRLAALQHQECPEHPPRGARRRTAAMQTDTLRVMTYNVHSCIGMDGKIDAARIARVIARARPDVVALQELDVGQMRSFGMDQAHLIARYLEMEFHFHPAIHIEEERYGDAILTHLPQRLVKAGLLPGLAGTEPRGALWVAIDVHGRTVQLINTHLGLHPRERAAQVEALLGSDWLGHEDCREPVILCGDLNAVPSSPTCRKLGRQLIDAQIEARNHRPQRTFSSRFPSLRLDHIFISSGLEVSGIEVSNSELARVASDHLPLLAELRLPGREPPARTKS